MRSPDVYSGYPDSEDSFENFVTSPTITRKRSRAIKEPVDVSFNSLTGSGQETVIDNYETVLVEDLNPADERVFLDDTLTRMLESIDDEDEIEANQDNDALSNLLKSFKAEDWPRHFYQENIVSDNVPSTSRAGLEGFNEDEEHYSRNERNQSIEEDAIMLPVALPIEDNVNNYNRKRPMASKDLRSVSSSTLHSQVAVVSSSECLNQPETMHIHGKNFEINNFNDYMRMKITKLNYQVNSEKSKHSERISNCLNGYSVFVNGYTDPPALVIRDLILAHGGEYHCYYQHGITSYTIASSVANAKINRIREGEIFIKADWVIESIAAGKPLDYRDFLIYEKGSQENGKIQKFLKSNSETATGNNSCSTFTNKFSDSPNTNFIREYYARSRLHLISTLAQDMKDFVANLKIEKKLIEKSFPESDLEGMGQGNNTKIQHNTIFHVDLDCFFVSVAVRDRPELKNKEVAITHSKGTISNSMSEVASCSYAARNCGVKNGMLVRDALQKCPQLTLLPYQFDDYVKVSRKVYEILGSYTLELRAVSCDEMYINMSHLCDRYGIHDATLLAEHIRKIIKETTRCPASVGIGSTSLLARLATRHAKPDGVYWVKEEKIAEFMLDEKVRDLPGLGYEMMSRLNSIFGNITKCSQLQQKSERELIQVFGPKLATKIFKQCRGIEKDPDDFFKTYARKSVSCDINYGIRFTTMEEVSKLIAGIGSELERKLIDCKLSAGSITMKLMVRSANAPLQTAKFMGHGICDSFTKTCNLSIPTNRGEILTAEAMKLYEKVSPKVEDLRGVGITCGKLKNKCKTDTASVVQKMFGKTKKDVNEAIKDQQIEADSPEYDAEMREQVIQLSSAVSLEPRAEKLPHPSLLKVASGLDMPRILLQPNFNIRKLVKSHVELEDEYLLKKNESQLKSVLQNEPTEENVAVIYDLLSNLLSFGKISTFEATLRIFEETSRDSGRCHMDWYLVYHMMLPYLNERSRKLFQFPISFDHEEVVKQSNMMSVNSTTCRKQLVPREVFVKDSTKHT